MFKQSKVLLAIMLSVTIALGQPMAAFAQEDTGDFEEIQLDNQEDIPESMEIIVRRIRLRSTISERFTLRIAPSLQSSSIG